METGTIAKWLKTEGEAVAAGDVICQVETDKAVVDFEAQDDMFVAKILKPEGAADINVGEPIFVSVLDESDVAAFSDFQLEDSKTKSSPAPEAEKKSAPKSEPAPKKTETKSAPEPKSSKSSSDRVIASPLAKKVRISFFLLLSVLILTALYRLHENQEFCYPLSMVLALMVVL